MHAQSALDSQRESRFHLTEPVTEQFDPGADEGGWDLPCISFFQVLHLREDKTLAFPGCAAELIDQPMLTPMQHANIEVAPELLHPGIGMRVVHTCFSHIRQL